MQQELKDILPVMGVEHNAILSRQGDVTIAYDVQLPELFTMSDNDYESLHQSLIKAIKLLPKNTVFHKQDWFTEATYKADFSKDDKSFLTGSSERFFNERPYLDHQCYIMITKKPSGRKVSSSIFSNLLRRSIVPEETLKPQLLQDFLDSAGQFERILQDSGFIKLVRLKDDDLSGDHYASGLIERYMNLHANESNYLLRDINFSDGIRIGNEYCQLYTLGDAENLPSHCGSRINYDKYSTDKTKFSVGFASPLGQLLSCNHIYNQYIFLEDPARTIQKAAEQERSYQAANSVPKRKYIRGPKGGCYYINPHGNKQYVDRSLCN